MPVINKLDFNNQVIKMRNTAKQAKIHAIHKLVRKVKQLTDKAVKRDDDDKTKMEVKASKLREEILILKVLKLDEISSYALVSDSDPNRTLADTNSGPKVRALARLCLHERLSTAAKLFQNKYPDWKKTFPTVLVALKTSKKLKLPKTKQSIKDGDKAEKQQKDSDNSNSSDGSENSESEDGSVYNSSGQGNSDSDNMEVSDKEGDSDELVQRVSSKKASKEIPKPKASNKKNTSKSVERPVKKSKKNFTDEDNLAFGKSEADSSEETDPDKKRFVDPFFLKKDDTEYLSLAPVDEKKDDEPTDFGRGKLFEDIPAKQFRAKDPKWKQDNKRRMSSFGSYTDKNARHKDKPVLGKSKQMFDRKETVCEKDIPIEELHPSWAAKKKSSAILPFQGKKVQFD